MDEILYNKICIMCPTRGRSETKLPVFINSVFSATSDISKVCFCFIVNIEDCKTIKKIAELCENRVEYELVTEDTEECDLSYYYNLAYDKSKFIEPGTCISMFGDDMVFITKGWESMVLDKINETFGYSVVYGDDDYCQHQDLCVYFVTTRELVEATGMPFMCRSFAVDYIDNVWMDFANKLNCAIYLPNLHVKHDHATRDKAPDPVWLRMRNQFNKSHKNMVEIEDYAYIMVSNVKKYLSEKYLNDDIAYCMATYNRVEIFRKTVTSWNKSVLLPKKLFVFDDASDKIIEITNEANRMINAYLVPSNVRFGCNKKNALVISCFDESAVMMIDSDTAFAPHWCIAMNIAWRKIKDDPKIAGVTLFNAKSHEMIEDKGGFFGLNLKGSVGGFGTLYKNEVISKSLGEVDIPKTSITWSWDNFVNDSVKAAGKRYCSTQKSYLQHIGYTEGTHVNDGEMCDYAPDFIGKLENQFPVKAGPVYGGSKILFAAMARMGDIIAASMVANMLIMRGMQLSVMVIKRYADFVQRICPEASIIPVEPLVGGPQGEWSETTTNYMKTKYPNYAVYINAQVGSRENHQEYVTSGKHPCIWIKDLCSRALGIDLETDFKKYLLFNKSGIFFNDRTVKIPDRLAIISKDAATAQSFPPEMPKKIFNMLQSQGFSPRFLVEKRPQRCSIREVREEYIFGLSIEQCIILLQHATHFVGQDSGLSWCSLYSNCTKQIYHKRSRIEMVNTYFKMIDPKAEDIILED